MVVVARIPRIEPEDGGDGAERRADVAPADRPDAVPVPASPRGAETAPGTRRGGRRPGARFPTFSTLFLAVVAGACWLAVWRQERLDRHRAAALAGAELPGGIAVAPQTLPDTPRSVTR